MHEPRARMRPVIVKACYYSYNSTGKALIGVFILHLSPAPLLPSTPLLLPALLLLASTAAPRLESVVIVCTTRYAHHYSRPLCYSRLHHRSGPLCLSRRSGPLHLFCRSHPHRCSHSLHFLFSFILSCVIHTHKRGVEAVRVIGERGVEDA